MEQIDTVDANDYLYGAEVGEGKVQIVQAKKSTKQVATVNRIRPKGKKTALGCACDEMG